MAIFSKRTLQRLLNENSKLMSAVDFQKYVDRFNKDQNGFLSTEWEIAILNALSKVGDVKYEQSFGRNKHPDLFFTSTENPQISFLADITAASDKGYENDNPINDFKKEFMKGKGSKGVRSTLLS